ncbi:MAG: toll/interleukin-1 receptor domain-containing protein [Pseudomonadota bacterium]
MEHEREPFEEVLEAIFKRTGEEWGAAAQELVLKVMSAVSGIDDVPYAQLSILFFLANREAQAKEIWEERGFDYQNTADQLFAREAQDIEDVLSNDNPLLETNLVCLIGCCMGYLVAQLHHKGHLTPLHVDIDLLKQALLRSKLDPVSTYTDPESDRLIHIGLLMTYLHIARANKTEILSQFSFEYIFSSGSEHEQSVIEWMMMRCVLFGTMIFRLSDNLLEASLSKDLPGKRIFISYSRRDKRRASSFRKMFEEQGYDVWIDEKDIPVGSSITKRIGEGIESECDYFVLLLSTNSIESKWVSREIEQATLVEDKLDRIFFLPVRLDDVDVPNYLNIKRYADAKRSTRSAFEEILAAIKWSNSRRGT